MSIVPYSVIIAMEFAENGTILDLLRSVKNLCECDARKYFLQLMSALTYLHSKDIAHRDLKLENLLLDTKYVLKLSDFGFARSIASDILPPRDTRCFSNTFCGSAAYASPEILKHLSYDPKQSDAWAAGVILYAMVYGRLPFNDSSLPLLLKSLRNGPQFPCEPPVSEACKKLILNLIAPLDVRLKTEHIIPQRIEWLRMNLAK